MEEMDALLVDEDIEALLTHLEEQELSSLVKSADLVDLSEETTHDQHTLEDSFDAVAAITSTADAMPAIGGIQFDHGVPKANEKLPRANSSVRAKHERKYLRQQVEELEAELDRLKRTEPTERPTESVWASIAKRQRDAKQLAEIENTKLREQLQGQLKVARSLEKLLRKRQNDSSSLEWNNTKRPRFVMTSENDEAMFSLIHASLNNRPIAVDDWLRESGLDKVDKEWNDAQVRCGDKDDIYLELVTTRVFPFPFEKVAQIVWKWVCVTHYEVENGTFSTVERSDQHCLMRSSFTLKLRRLEAEMDTYAVGRRDNQPNRVVVSMESRSTTCGSLFRDEHVSLREKSFLVIERKSSEALHSTLVKSCARIRPVLDDSASADRHFELMTDVLIAAYNVSMPTMYQMIENDLLEAL